MFACCISFYYFPRRGVYFPLKYTLTHKKPSRWRVKSSSLPYVIQQFPFGAKQVNDGILKYGHTPEILWLLLQIN